MTTQPTNEDLLNVKKQFNKFLNQLTSSEEDMIIDLMNEAREYGYDKGYDDAVNFHDLKKD